MNLRRWLLVADQHSALRIDGQTLRVIKPAQHHTTRQKKQKRTEFGRRALHRPSVRRAPVQVTFIAVQVAANGKDRGQWFRSARLSVAVTAAAFTSSVTDCETFRVQIHTFCSLSLESRTVVLMLPSPSTSIGAV